jgi:hypothetical protein
VLGKLLKYRAVKKRLSEQSLPPDEMRALREAKLHEFSHQGINECTMLRCDLAAWCKEREL